MAPCFLLASTASAQNITTGNLEISLSRPVFNELNSGLRIPTAFDAPDDGSNDFYISGLSGRIHKFENGVEASNPPFLSIPAVRTGSGSGLLGMVLHPDFASPGAPGYQKLYTYHSEDTTSGGTPTFEIPNTTTILHNVVTEWQVSSSNSDLVDMSTRREIYREAHPTDVNHNGGALDFGPDGYLYVTTGVPPGAFGYAQQVDNILGKVLRIDPIQPSLNPSSADPVSGNGQYRIPASNPFVSTPSALGEIYAIGLRNPYRMSVDSESGLVFLGDVGQGSREEVDAFGPGANLGWPYREGTLPYQGTPPEGTVLTDPIAEYTHADGRSITGGFVYRGSIPELYGKYIFAEFSYGTGPFGSTPGRLLWIDPFDAEGDLRDSSEIEIKEFRFSANTQAIFDSYSPDAGDNIDITIYSLGLDDDGEIYIQGEEANKLTVYKITGALNLSPSGDFDGDLDVDGRDFLVWQRGKSPTPFSASDLTDWQTNYGINGASNASVAVPEPSSCLTVILAAVAFSLRRR